MKHIRTLHKILISLLISFTVIALFFWSSLFLKVRKIETNANPTDMQGFPALGDTYLFNVSEAKLTDYFSKKPTVKQVKITKKFPSTLKINIEYREKLVEINAANGLFIADSEGVIFEKVATSSAYPMLDLSSRSLNLGTNIAQNSVKRALIFLKAAKIKNIDVANVSISDKYELFFTLTDGTLVVIGENSEPEHIVSSLQTLLKRFTIEGTKVSKIDFRFDKPYITF